MLHKRLICTNGTIVGLLEAVWASKKENELASASAAHSNYQTFCHSKLGLSWSHMTDESVDTVPIHQILMYQLHGDGTSL
jgi:hypothetical protein